MKRLVITIALACGVVLAGALLSTPAIADPNPTPPCFGSGCNGLDPDQLRCDIDSDWNATWTSPPVEIAGGGVTLWLRYSPWCNANWAKLSRNVGDINLDSLYVHNTNGDISFMSGSAPFPGGETDWSAMVDGSVAAQAVVEWDNAVSGFNIDQTGWY